MLALKRSSVALEKYQRALALRPDHAEAHKHCGNILKDLGHYRDALECYEHALMFRPDHPEVLLSRGNALKHLRRYDEALQSYDRALSSLPAYAEACSDRANALCELGRYEEALAGYDRALNIRPEYAEACYNRGNTLKELRRFEEALASYDRALAIRADFVAAHTNRGVALHDLGRYEEGLASYDRALAIRPDYAEAYYNRGLALHDLNRYDEALASYERTLACAPDHAEAHTNRGLTRQVLRRYHEALASYERALTLRPDYAIGHWNRSLCRLMLGDFARGLEEYEWRWKYQQLGNVERDFPQPLWLGKEPLKDKTILLHAEQGLGDAIQFCRYVALVAALGARVILEVYKPLVPLLKNLRGVSQLVERGAALPAFDCHCPLLSLPLAFKTDMDSIPAARSYLAADPIDVDKWRARLGPKTRVRIGLAWSGSARHKNDRNRSIALAELLARLPTQYQYISLQQELRDADRQTLASHAGMLHFGDELQDFADTAALCELMDVVISVDTSVAHLAGALGKPVWILLSYVSDWRWFLDRADSPWYPSATLYRQERSGDWSALIGRMGSDLAKQFGSQAPRTL